MNKLLFFAFILLALSSCNEKTIEIPPFEIPKTDKVVLIEELTGVRCPNCPNGAVVIKNLEEKYEGKVISIAMHAGDLSEPYKEGKYDLRCEDGTNLENKFLPYYGKPAAVIDRLKSEDEPGLPLTGARSWPSQVEKALKVKSVVNIYTSVEYNPENRELKVSLSIIPKEDLEGEFKVNVAITESHIIDFQLDGSEINEEYEFENVLKDMLTPYDGEVIGTDLSADETIEKSYTFTFPQSDGTWIAENMKVVTYVTGGAESSFYPVLNATQNKVVE